MKQEFCYLIDLSKLTLAVAYAGILYGNLHDSVPLQQHSHHSGCASAAGYRPLPLRPARVHLTH